MTQPTLYLHDSQTRSKRAFVPLNTDKKIITMYVCGITPYDDAHIGHARVYVVFDVLYRLLKHLYEPQGYTVHYLRNYTDIDDKIIQRAAENGEAPTVLSERVIQSFEADMEALGCLKPTHQPKVSTSLPAIMGMVNGLLEKGMAYVTPSGDVMYRTAKFPRFGELAGRSIFENEKNTKVKIAQLISGLGSLQETILNKRFGLNGNEPESIKKISMDLGMSAAVVSKHITKALKDLRHPSAASRIQIDEDKDSDTDFVLWKANAKSATKLEQAFNPTDYGATFEGFNAPGRPGWHIECSAMSYEYLSQNGLGVTLDIHGGGEDLKFPHHCCEIAQSEGLFDAPLANYWLHNSFITVNGTKMSKSLGNFTTIKDALAKYSPEAIRLWLLQTHYRKPVDYSDEALKAAGNRWNNFIPHTYWEGERNAAIEPFFKSLLDDLNTSGALAELGKIDAEYIEDILGLNVDNHKYQEIGEDEMNDQELVLSGMRATARANKNWAESDRLRDELKSLGIIVEDHKDGTTTWRRS